MNRVLKLAYLVMLSIFMSCGGDDDGGPSVSEENEGGQMTSVSYNVEFITNFTEENNPQDYPTNASFGTIIAIAHAPEVSIFNIGQLASEGVALYVESGDVEGLATFIENSLGNLNDGLFSISTAGVASAQASTNFSITITPVRNRITFLARLNPSPDWFLGVNSFDVVDGNTLIDLANIELFPLDAGVVLGDTYLSDGGDENAAISIYNGLPFGDGSSITEPLANLIIEKVN